MFKCQALTEQLHAYSVVILTTQGNSFCVSI